MKNDGSKFAHSNIALIGQGFYVSENGKKKNRPGRGGRNRGGKSPGTVGNVAVSIIILNEIRYHQLSEVIINPTLLLCQYKL
ncbi:hypothetical protein GCM10011332_12690 [Terasakiella brassicae]|uniref:Uncharacterized protein n=1 Tax=Terasakiella brassicae TaxID=1634917 RepID=A0A917F8Q4_9PROT|nr:hypothetical protein GCM10011332_12690 [Terasakiella brassicae]